MKSSLRFLLAVLLLLAAALAASTAKAQLGSESLLGSGLYLPMLWRSPSNSLSGCPVFPADHIWNTPIDRLPVHPNSSAIINSIGMGASASLKADFGSGLWNGGPIGIPYAAVAAGQPKVPVTFQYADESDPGPYPIPANAPIEGGPDSDGDRHVLVVDSSDCKLYELFYARRQPNGSWTAGSGAVFDLRGYALRPNGWTSADAAGLPILAGLVRYDEVAAGEIHHALRVTGHARDGYVWPARHRASNPPYSTCANCPVMGQRFRLKASVDITGFSPEVQVILRAMKTYGLIFADNGSPWFVSGVPDERWNNDALHALRNLHGSDFEVVDGTALMIDPNSGQARQP